MSLSAADAVQDAFRAAVRSDLQKRLHTGADWDRYSAIVAEATERIAAEDRAFARDYPQRMADAKEIILREEHGVRLDQPLPPGIESQSDATTLEHLAKDRVDKDHARRCAAIRRDEMNAYSDLLTDIRSRDAQRGVARESFTRASHPPHPFPNRTR